MAIPVRNTLRSAGIQAPYTASLITTPSGAVVTGEIKRYDCYKDMINDAAPAALASVLNASMDKDYEVPAEHVGGILYQYDAVNANWILLYDSNDVTVPTRIDWPNVLNVPKWVGGVTNNRVKLTKNMYAETRTTYYSYGDYILVLPDPANCNVGDEVVLEQYKGQGAVCFPYIASESEDWLVNIDGSGLTQELYHVLYTYADYAYTRDASGQMVIDTTNPINHNQFKFTLTETEAGARIWRFNSNDSIENTVISLRKEHFKHTREVDPHHQYILKKEVGKYISSLYEIHYTLPDATTYRLGGVYIATPEDVTSNVVGNKAVTANVLNNVLSTYSPATHNHALSNLVDVEGVPEHGQVLIYMSALGKWTPKELSDSAVVYDVATTENNGVVRLGTAQDLAAGSSGAIVVNTQVLSSTLENYTKQGEYPAIINLTDVNISTLVNGKILTVANEKVVLGDYPTATTTSSGCILIAGTNDIASGTTVADKAITPVQVMTVSARVIEEVKQLIQTSGYVLPSATLIQLGGCKLINDTTLDLVVSDYPTFTSHIVDSATLVNPMQFARYIHTVSQNVSSSTSAAISAYGVQFTARIDSIAAVAQSAASAGLSAFGLVTDLTSTVQKNEKKYASIDWSKGSDITGAALRTEIAPAAEFTAPRNGFIKFHSVPNANADFCSAVGSGGTVTASGCISGGGVVHFAQIAIESSAFAPKYCNCNVDTVPINSGDKAYLLLFKYDGSSSSYFDNPGFYVTYYPGKDV